MIVCGLAIRLATEGTAWPISPSSRQSPVYVARWPGCDTIAADHCSWRGHRQPEEAIAKAGRTGSRRDAAWNLARTSPTRPHHKRG